MNNNIFFNKYNPDVNDKYKQILNRDQNFQFSNKIWNGITGSEFANKINNSNDLKIIFNDDINYNTINLKHQNEILNRKIENDNINEKNKLINNMKINNSLTIENKNDEPTDINIVETKTHIELKKIQINNNDILKNEKEQFNKLLFDIEKMF